MRTSPIPLPPDLWLLPCPVPGTSPLPPTTLLHPPPCAPRTTQTFCVTSVPTASVPALTARAPLLVPLTLRSALKIFAVSSRASGHKSTGWGNSSRAYAFTHVQRRPSTPAPGKPVPHRGLSRQLTATFPVAHPSVTPSCPSPRSPRHGQDYTERITTFVILHLDDHNFSASDSESALIAAPGLNLLQPLVSESGKRWCPRRRLTAGLPGPPGAQRVRASPAPAALPCEDI